MEPTRLLNRVQQSKPNQNNYHTPQRPLPEFLNSRNFDSVYRDHEGNTVHGWDSECIKQQVLQTRTQQNTQKSQNPSLKPSDNASSNTNPPTSNTSSTSQPSPSSVPSTEALQRALFDEVNSALFPPHRWMEKEKLLPQCSTQETPPLLRMQCRAMHTPSFRDIFGDEEWRKRLNQENNNNNNDTSDSNNTNDENNKKEEANNTQQTELNNINANTDNTEANKPIKTHKAKAKAKAVQKRQKNKRVFVIIEDDNDNNTNNDNDNQIINNNNNSATASVKRPSIAEEAPVIVPPLYNLRSHRSHENTENNLNTNHSHHTPRKSVQLSSASSNIADCDILLWDDGISEFIDPRTGRLREQTRTPHRKIAFAMPP